MRPEVGKITVSQNSKWKQTLVSFPLHYSFQQQSWWLSCISTTNAFCERLTGKAEMKCLIRLCCWLWHHGIFPILLDTSRPDHALCPFLPVSSASPDSRGSNQFAILPGNLHAQEAALLSLPLKPTATLFFKLF